MNESPDAGWSVPGGSVHYGPAAEADQVGAARQGPDDPERGSPGADSPGPGSPPTGAAEQGAPTTGAAEQGAPPTGTPGPWSPPTGTADPGPPPAGAEDTAPVLLVPATLGGLSLQGDWRDTPAPHYLTTVDKLRDGVLLRRDRLTGWAVTLVITAIAGVLRFVNLAVPAKLVFDETYYAKDAWTLWIFGYETKWPDKINDAVAAGNSTAYLDTASFIVHPPVGKLLIGLGEQWFGLTSFGWRFMPAVFGTLLVFITIRLARRLSRSTLIGAIAGILLTFDGLAFTMSRMALLDIFQAFFLVAAVAACVADRDWYRHRLADKLESLGLRDLGGTFGPVVWLRPWRLVAGIAFGLAIGTKWNSIYLLAVMGLLSVWWDIRARNLAGARWQSALAIVVDGLPAIVRMVVVAAVVYVASWTPWLVTTGGYDRSWGADNPDSPWTMYLGERWASFLKYHQDILAFHTGTYINNATHPYDAPPAGWLAMVRPISIDYVGQIQPGDQGCRAAIGDTCVQAITAMGTPILWWMALVALIVAAIWWVGARDWRFGVPVLAALSTYVPWFFAGTRPVFFFYAITIVPFTVISLALVLGLILGPAGGPHRRRGAIIVGLAVALVVANFAYLYPVLTDETIPYSEWLARMWSRTWI